MDAPASRGLIVAAFAAVYLIWGSTYLAIRVTLETLPPFSAAAARFLLAGAILYAYARLRGHAAPERGHWRGLAFVGGLLLLGGNGGVMWAQQHVPSGLASVIIASIPIFVAVFDAVASRGSERAVAPSPAMILGVLLGFGGLVLLVSARTGTSGAIDPLGAAALLCSAFCWALGSVGSRHVSLPPSLIVSTACQMLCGGALLAVASAFTGEWAKIDPSRVSGRSLLAVSYLIVFGSIVAYSAYVWLLRTVAPTRVATYAYVNPIVALLLGWGFAGEELHARTLGAAGLTILGVVVIVTARSAKAAAPKVEAPTAPAAPVAVAERAT